MHLLLMTFGTNERHHLQACFCVYSFLAGGARFSSINIMTDSPGFYKSIENNVKVIAVSDELLTEWKGPHAFFWRIKIKAIGQVCDTYPGEPVIYLDTDTFLYNDFEKAHSIVAGGHAGMHLHEAPLKRIATKTASKMYTQLRGKSLGDLRDLSDFDMWNAGVVITPNNRGMEEIRLALSICDEMLRLGVVPILIEQYSLSIALHHIYGLKPAASFLAHYWSNKDEWNQLISGFFHRCYLEALSQEETIEKFRSIPLESIPVSRKVRRMNLKLKKAIDGILPNRNLTYLGSG
ncbi:MAG: hypothetical protein ABWZ25_05800 [Chitinophagaceae bacterium]